MKYGALLAGWLIAVPCQAQNWFNVSRPASPQPGAMVEVDLDTVRAIEHGGEGIIRASFDAPRPHGTGFAYRSFVGTAQFDCRQRSITLTSAAYFLLPQAQGPRLGADSSGRDAGMPPDLVESLPLRAREALLRAACAQAKP